MPCKRDIDPTEMLLQLLPNLQMIEVIEGGERFRYRLVGTALVEAYGEEFTGKCSDELLSGERLRFNNEMYRAVCTSKAPLFAYNKYKSRRDIEFAAHRIYMPLSEDGVNVHFIFGVIRLGFRVHGDTGLWGDGGKIGPNGTIQRTDRRDRGISITTPVTF